MKVLFDARVHLNYFSGISRYIICLLEAYLELFQNDEVIVLVNPTIKKNDSLYRTLDKFSNVSFKVIDAGHMGPKNYYKMGKVIKNISPDVYHYPHLDTPIFTGSIPIVATVHDRNSNDKIKKFDDKLGLKSLYFKKSLGLTLKHASHVVFVSDSVKNEVLTAYNVKNTTKFSRIYNGLENDFNQISETDKQLILSNFDIKKPYVLFVGQIREHKNIRRIVEAFKLFKANNTTHQLVIVGHNYLQLDLNEKSIRHIEKVSNLQLKALYSGCTSFIFPSLFEGFGFPIIEAFSFGKKVVTSNYGATKEISKGQAILVDPDSVTEILKGIEASIVKDDLNQNRINLSKSYSWTENAKKIREIYLKVIG